MVVSVNSLPYNYVVHPVEAEEWQQAVLSWRQEVAQALDSEVVGRVERLWRALEHLSCEDIFHLLCEQKEGTPRVSMKRQKSFLALCRKSVDNYFQALQNNPWKLFCYQITRPSAPTKKVYLVGVEAVGMAALQEKYVKNFWNRFHPLLNSCRRLCTDLDPCSISQELGSVHDACDRVAQHPPAKRELYSAYGTSFRVCCWAHAGNKEVLSWETVQEQVETVQESIRRGESIPYTPFAEKLTREEDRSLFAEAVCAKSFSTALGMMTWRALGRQRRFTVPVGVMEHLFSARGQKFLDRTKELFSEKFEGNSMVALGAAYVEREGGLAGKLAEQGYRVTTIPLTSTAVQSS